MENTQFYLHIAFGISLTLVAYIITMLMRRVVRIMDEPNLRSSHQKAVPRAGGVSIVITWLIGMAVIFYLGAINQIERVYLEGFVISALLIAIISLVDDISEKSAMFKLQTQIVAVLVVLYYGIILDEMAFPGFGYVELGWFGVVFSFFWIVGLTNAYNFMDGLDGLAGGVAVIASLFFMVITYHEGSSFVYITCYTILAGALGFLFLNFPPARIILGDVGAAFLGFVFATLAIIAARYDESHTSFLVIPLLMFHFIYDTFFTFLRRLFKGENVTQAHRTHLYQLMNRNGYSHLEVVLIQYCMVFMQGLGAMWLVQIPGDQRLFVFVPFLIFQAWYTVVVIKKAKRLGVIE